jgi:uncharacterized protein (DUF983 family)
MAHDDMNAHSAGLELPSFGRTLRLLGRAFRLRCPNCGQGPVLESWFRTRTRCGSCGIRLERGEHDYFAGSMLLNFCLTGLLLLVGLAIFITSQSPNVPWDALEWAGPVAMLALPFILFPFTKLLWLAADIAMRPVTPQELEWHRNAESAFSTDREARG